jgi:hypothetical protein
MMEKKLRVARSTALLGVALAMALLAIPAAALSGGEDAGSDTSAAWQAPSSGGPPAPALSGAHAMASSTTLEDRSGYDSSFLFAMSRGLAQSTVVTPLKPVLFLFTVPLDIVLLPFAAIGGFF